MNAMFDLSGKVAVVTGGTQGIGFAAAGTVEAVGPGVEGFVEGDRVAYYTLAPGAYATARTLPAERREKCRACGGDAQGIAARSGRG